MSLFNSVDNKPLAFRLRPASLDEFYGQDILLGKNGVLRNLIEADKIKSLIIFGPPGCGKSLIAYIIAKRTKSEFFSINAVTSNVKELRELIKKAENNLITGLKTIIFIDEIHRFNKIQQDALLPSVESGIITLIGATTQNPFFYIVPALQSRSHIFKFEPLNKEALKKILENGLIDKKNGLGQYNIQMSEDIKSFLIQKSSGDARKLLNLLEMAFITAYSKNKELIVIDESVLEIALQQKINKYDKDGDYHYDIISAFIKSIRGTDPDAAVYWLARMLDAGEDIRFIARRLVILASEDIGNADPIALILAQSCFDAVNHIGMPEARIILSHTATYLASAPKSNSAYLAIDKALQDIKAGKLLRVPEHLKNFSPDSVEGINRSECYKYPHDYRFHYVKQEYLPEDVKYYEPNDLGYEKKIKERLEKLKNL